MDIYGIVLIGKIIAFTLGPWSEGSMEDCQEGARELEQTAMDTIPAEGQMVNGERIHVEDVEAFCQKFEVRPEVGTVYIGEH